MPIIFPYNTGMYNDASFTGLQTARVKKPLAVLAFVLAFLFTFGNLFILSDNQLRVKRDMTSGQWGSCGVSSLVSLGGAAINGAGFGRAVGSLGGNSAIGYGLQKATEGFVTSGLTAAGNALANGMDWNSMTMDTKSWKMTNSFNMDWNSVGMQTVVAGANGFAAGSLASGLKGSYDSKSGGFGFRDDNTSTAMGKNVNMFYSGNIMQVADTFGSIVGEGVNFAYGNNFRLNLGQGIGLGINHEGKVVDDYTGGGIGLNDLVHSAMNMKYVGFQAGNMDTPKGRSTMSYVNLNNGVGNSGLADDIISGNKKVVYNPELKESGNDFGHAGNNTIELSESAILDEKDSFLKQKLAFYTATMAHEGTHLDQNSSGADGQDKERQAYAVGTLTTMNLEKKYGLSVAGNSQYSEMTARGAYFAMTGDAKGSGLNMSGNSLSISLGLPTVGTINKNPQNYDIENKNPLTKGTIYAHGIDGERLPMSYVPLNDIDPNDALAGGKQLLNMINTVYNGGIADTVNELRESQQRLASGQADMLDIIGLASLSPEAAAAMRQLTESRLLAAATDKLKSALNGGEKVGVEGSVLKSAIANDTETAGSEILKPDEFKISDWTGYPDGVPKPEGPFKLLEGDEYQQARSAANKANQAIRKADPSIQGLQIHEIQPVKFNGSPTDIENKMLLDPALHSFVTTWWNKYMKNIKAGGL